MVVPFMDVGIRVVITFKAINSDSFISETYSAWIIMSGAAGRMRTKAPGKPVS